MNRSKVIVSLVLIVIVLGLQACNTLIGACKDVGAASQAIADSASRKDRE